MKKFGLLKASLIATGLIGGSPALSCQYEFAPEPIGGPSAKFLAPKMSSAATFVDLAIAEGETEFPGPDGKVVPWSKAVSFRVLRRWKGASADRFILFGSVVDAKAPGWSLAHWVDDQGRIEPFESVREGWSSTPTGMSSCDPPALGVTVGQTYLVLREADGRLLGAVQYHPGGRAARGTPIAKANLWPDDEWARQMSYTVEAPKLGPAAVPAGTPDPTRATVRFRTPLTPAAGTDLLRLAGAKPFAVTLIRNGITSDYRLGSDQAWLGIIADAATWAGRSRTDPLILQAQARALVDAYSVSSVTMDTAKREHARMVLALAQAPAEEGPALVSSVTFIGGPPVQRALAVRPEVADVVPATIVRGRLSTAPPLGSRAGDPLPDMEPVDLHRRLSAIAGRAIPPNALEGRWRVVGSYESDFGEEVMTLSFRNGHVTATLPCIPAVTGTYRLEGQGLEIALPKPSLKPCPQRHSFWTADYFFGDSKVMTARLTGDKLLLIGNGGEYRFARGSAS
jgi:hypothetical protein